MPLICLGLTALIFFGELCIKNHVEKHLDDRTDIVLPGRLLVIRRFHNHGAFLGFLKGFPKALRVVSLMLTLCVGLIFIRVFKIKEKGALKLALALLLGGAFSNTYDRLKRKYVVDYFSFGFGPASFRRIVYNVSDFCIIIGTIWMALSV